MLNLSLWTAYAELAVNILRRETGLPYVRWTDPEWLIITDTWRDPMLNVDTRIDIQLPHANLASWKNQGVPTKEVRPIMHSLAPLNDGARPDMYDDMDLEELMGKIPPTLPKMWADIIASYTHCVRQSFGRGIPTRKTGPSVARWIFSSLTQ